MTRSFVQTTSIIQRLKISSVLITMLLPLLCVGVYVASGVHLNRLAEIYRRNQLSGDAQQLGRIIEAHGEILERISTEGAKPRYQEILNNTIASEEVQIEKLLAHSKSIEIRDELKRLRADLSEFKGIIGRIFNAEGANIEHEILLTKQLHIESKEVLTRIQLHWQEESMKTFEQMYRNRYFPLQVAVVLTLLGMPLALFLGFSIMKRVRRSVQNFLKATEAISQGQLSFRAPILEHDEIGLITHAFNQMAESLKSTTVSRDYVLEIIESMNDGVIVSDHKGVIQRSNRNAARLLDLTEAELHGRPIESIFEGLSYEYNKPNQNQERTVIKSDGESRFVLISISWISAGADHHSDMVCVVKDITERKESEDRLKATHEKLVTANADLESFSYSVSHDLRSPLRSIDGFSQAILEDYGDQLTGEAKDYFNRIRAATIRMGQLIDALLGLAKVTRGELKRERVEIGKIVKQIGEDLSNQNRARKVEFKVDEAVVADGDPGLLRVVVENLIGNAFKFTSNVPEARIEFGSVSRDGKEMYFVKDNGAGFDMAYADKLFGVFQRLHAQEQFAGTGIGLATVRRILLRHGGEIRAEAAVGKGATFYFSV